MVNSLDKKLAEKNKLRNWDLEDRLARIKGQWKIIFFHYYTFLFAVCFICFGIYYDWKLKNMIGKAFGYILTAVLTFLIENFISRNKKKEI